MTSGVDELEAFIAALRLSFITSSTVAGSPEGLRQGIAAFRETLKPRGPLAASPAPTEAYTRKDSNINTSGSDIFAHAGEPISSTSTVWSDDDRIDVASLLTKQMELVNTEVREGASQIRELIQSVKELKAEVRDLRSALATSEPAASSEALKDRKSSAPSHQAQLGSPPEQRLGIVASSPSFSSVTCAQSSAAVDSGDSVPSLLASVSSSELSLEDKNGVANPMKSGACDPNHEVTIQGEDVNDPKISKVADLHPKSPVIATATDPYGASGEDEIGFQPGDKIEILGSPNTPVGWMYGERLSKRRGIFLARNVKELAPQEITEMLKNDHGVGNPGVLESSSKSLRVVTPVRFVFLAKPGELSLLLGEKIAILDSPDTPAGWMYGELIEKRRGIFPARYVKLDK